MLINHRTSTVPGRSPEAVDLYWWQGQYGDFVMTSVFDLRGLTCREPGVFLLVRRDEKGNRTPLYVGWAGSISDDLCDDLGDPYLRAIRDGANEIHVHFIDDPSCRALITDIAAKWAIESRSVFSLV